MSTCLDWTSGAAVVECQPCVDLDADNISDYVTAASQVLRTLTGDQFGVCSETVYPNLACGDHRKWISDGGTSVHAVRLGYTPLQSITSVTVDGAALTLTDIQARIDDSEWLVRGDGLSWPTTEEWSVGITFGADVPQEGVIAANALACELALACVNDATCRLPKRTQSVARQGITMVINDPFTLLADGIIGIFEVDHFITTYNPSRTQGAQVVVPGRTPPSTVRTWEAS